ncbi:hypothetical protein D3C78_1448410 [compost metagenome]
MTCWPPYRFQCRTSARLPSLMRLVAETVIPASLVIEAIDQPLLQPSSTPLCPSNTSSTTTFG